MFEELYLQTAHVQRPSGLDRYGQVTLGPPVAFACRFQPSNKLVRTKDGDQAVASAVLYTAEVITTADLLFPPGADTDNPDLARSPLSVAARYDLLTGVLSHYEVTI